MTSSVPPKAVEIAARALWTLDWTERKPIAEDVVSALIDSGELVPREAFDRLDRFAKQQEQTIRDLSDELSKAREGYEASRAMSEERRIRARRLLEERDEARAELEKLREEAEAIHETTDPWGPIHIDVCPECETPTTYHGLDAPGHCPHEYERRVPVQYVRVSGLLKWRSLAEAVTQARDQWMADATREAEAAQQYYKKWQQFESLAGELAEQMTRLHEHIEDGHEPGEELGSVDVLLGSAIDVAIDVVVEREEKNA